MRRSLVCVVFLLAGCTSSDRLETAPKEIYVEAQRVDVATNRIPYPLDPESENRAYAAVRNFSTGRVEGRLKLGQLLDQYPEDTKSTADDPSPAGDEFELDLASFPDRDPPSLLLFPDLSERRDDSACYIGHSVFLRPLYAPGRQFVHHIRVLVVNRQARAVRIKLTDVTLEVPSIGSTDRATAGTGRTILATANAAGGRLDTLVVQPMRAGLGSIFFEDGRLPSALLVRVKIELETDSGDPSAPHESWEFSVSLVRRFVLAEGRINEVESRVAYEQPLREIRGSLEPWQEPHLSAIAPVGGDVGGDVGGGAGGGGE